MTELIEDETPDPFELLGGGRVLYRQTIWKLICIFGFFSLCTLPLMNMYKNADPAGISPIVNTKFARSSIANLGYTSVQCQLSPISFDTLSLSCPYGLITEIVPDGMGINLATAEVKDACLVSEDDFRNTFCSNYLDKSYINNWFNNSTSGCLGQDQCSIQIDSNIFKAAPPASNSTARYNYD